MSRRENMDMDVNYKSLPLRDLAEDIWNRHDLDRNRKIPISKMKEKIIYTKEADNLPNAFIIQLLRKADANFDGYIDYDEFMNFIDSVEAYSQSRQLISKAALVVLPRSERTLEKRSYIEEYTCCPPPFFMVIASVAELVVFIYYMVDMNLPMGASGPAPTYSPLIYNPFRRYEAWRYFSYALIHSGYMHLINNLLVQTFLGIILEMVHGWWRVGIIYFSGVLFGSLAHSITSPKSYLAGASGGVYAVEYAHLGNLILNWSEMEYKWAQMIVIILLSGWDFGFAIWDSYFNPTPSSTGHMAHFGGAIAGILVGIYILRNLEERKWEKYCWWVAFVIFFMLVGVGIILNAALPVPDFFPYDDLSPIADARAIFLSRVA